MWTCCTGHPLTWGWPPQWSPEQGAAGSRRALRVGWGGVEWGGGGPCWVKLSPAPRRGRAGRAQALTQGQSCTPAGMCTVLVVPTRLGGNKPFCRVPTVASLPDSWRDPHLPASECRLAEEGQPRSLSPCFPGHRAGAHFPCLCQGAPSQSPHPRACSPFRGDLFPMAGPPEPDLGAEPDGSGGCG